MEPLSPIDNQPHSAYNNVLSIEAKGSQNLQIVKKTIYFLHFIVIASLTTYVLIKYPQSRDVSFTLISIVFYGYMAFWTIIINFILLTVGKENWAVIFDRIFIKFLIMLWPIFALVSYVYESFIYIDQISYLTLYMTIISFLVILHEIYFCVFKQKKHPQFIFQTNNLQQDDRIIWDQRKKYNQNVLIRQNDKIFRISA